MRDVAFSCDDRGVPFLKVAVWSLLSRYKGAEPMRVNVFEGWGGHSAAHKAELEKIVGGFPQATLRYVDVERALAPYADAIAPREGSRWNVFTWTPVFTPMLIPDAKGNVVHFDIDMLFNADVSPLFELDFSNPQDPSRPNLVACAYEYDKYGDNAGREIWEKGILPPEVERYFNTGVLVFNSDACRAEATWEKIVKWYREHYDVADRIEQDAWNALYWDRVLPLHVKWNFHDRNIKGYAKWPLDSKYWLGNPPRECLEAAVEPCILHFWGPKKPWKPSHRPYRRLYHEAMREVGLKPPREQLFASVHDFVVRTRLAKFRLMLEVQADGELFRAACVWRRHCRWKRIKHSLASPFEWLGIAVGLLFLTSLNHRLMLALCDAAAALMYVFDRAGRRRSLEMLHVALGKADRGEGGARFGLDRLPYLPTPREEKIIKGSYRNMARTVGHAFWTCRNAAERVRKVGVMSEEGREFLRKNKPAVTVSGHIGCWEILSQLAFLEGHKMMSVAKNIGTRGMTSLLMKGRRSIGQEIVPADGAFRPLMAGIKAGKSLGLLVDQAVDADEGGVWVRFFGRPIPVSAAPAFFAAKAKAPIVVAWSRPLADGRYRCEVVDEISAEEAKDVWWTTQRCTTDLERIIRRHPSRWVMNYNFFRNVPSANDLKTLAEREAKVGLAACAAPRPGHVLYASDDNGYSQLCVAVFSLLWSADPCRRLRISVFTGDVPLSAEHVAALESLASSMSFASLEVIDVGPLLSRYESAFANSGTHWGPMIWARCFVGEVFGEDVGNVVYMDIDTFVCRDLGELYDMDMSDCGDGRPLVLGAVCEEHRESAAPDDPAFSTGLIDPRAEQYFNSGFLVMNVGAFRDEGLLGKIVAWYEEHKSVAKRPDQDTLNCMFWDRTRFLHPRYNHCDGWLERQAKCSLSERHWRGNSPREVLEAVLDPSILHFWGSRKPWKWNHRPEGARYAAAMKCLGLVDGSLPGTTPARRMVGALFAAYHALLRASVRRKLRKIREAEDE